MAVALKYRNDLEFVKEIYRTLQKEDVIVKGPTPFPELENSEGIKFKKLKSVEYRLKKILDYILAFIILIISLPFWIPIAIFIKFDSEGPVIFKQKRLGKSGRPFKFFKFRTMYNGVPHHLHKKFVEKLIKGENKCKVYKMQEDPRVTRFGRILRKTSLDELPQLINVLKGEMSLVGPRPQIDYEYKMAEDVQKMRLLVKPGITGLWQVMGRSKRPFNQMAFLDLYYISNMSIWLDLKILAKTIPAVLFMEGAY